jgi:hypothetical protein
MVTVLSKGAANIPVIVPVVGLPAAMGWERMKVSAEGSTGSPVEVNCRASADGTVCVTVKERSTGVESGSVVSEVGVAAGVFRVGVTVITSAVDAWADTVTAATAAPVTKTLAAIARTRRY